MGRYYAPGAYGPTQRPSRDPRLDPHIDYVPGPGSRRPTGRWVAVRGITRAVTRWPYAYALPFHWQVPGEKFTAPPTTPGTSLRGATPAPPRDWPPLAITQGMGRVVAPRAF